MQLKNRNCHINIKTLKWNQAKVKKCRMLMEKERIRRSEYILGEKYAFLTYIKGNIVRIHDYYHLYSMENTFYWIHVQLKVRKEPRIK